MNLENLFTVTSLTAAVNKLPVMPGKVGAMGLFKESGITTTSIVIDEHAGRLVLVQNTSRNDDPAPMQRNRRKRRTFETLHLPVSAPILPAELQNIAAFGSGTVESSQARVINDRMQMLKNSIEATREWQRVGALRGKLLDADGSVIYDLYTEFGVVKKSINIPFGVAGTDVRKFCMDAKRHAEKKLSGQMVSGYKAFCGPAFMDALTSHETVKETFANWQAAQDRLGGDVRSGFVYGGIEFVEYDVEVSGQKFFPDDIAQVFPVSPSVFQMYNAPANYNETVNTLGLPWYAKSEPRKMGKGWDMEVQANPLAMCLFPEALVELKIS